MIGFNMGNGDGITKNEIIEKINYELVPFVNCRRKCAAFKYCKFRKSTEDHCGLLIKFVENYIKTTFNSLTFKNDEEVKRYIQSIKFLIDFVLDYENWKGLILDKQMVNYWVGFHIKTNDWYVRNFLKNLAQYLEIYGGIHDIQKDYKYKIFVEGRSEIESLTKIGSEIGDCSIGSERNLFNIEGGGNIQNLKFLIRNFKENGIRTFFVLDRGDIGNRSKIDKLHEAGLINKNTDDFSFDVCFENAFPAEVIYESIQGIISNTPPSIDAELIREKLRQKRNILKELDKILIKQNNTKMSGRKIELAKRLSDKIIEFHKLNPGKRIEIIAILRRLSRQINRERQSFFLS